MDHRDDYEGSADSRKPVKPASGQQERPGRLEKAFRAITAIVVFGIPLVTGTAAVVGYGAYKAYKRVTDRS
jgi:hypothetical protein